MEETETVNSIPVKDSAEQGGRSNDPQTDTINKEPKKKERRFFRRRNAQKADKSVKTEGNNETATNNPIEPDIESNIKNNPPKSADEDVFNDERVIRVQNPIPASEVIPTIVQPIKYVEKRSADELAEIHFLGQLSCVSGVCEDLSEGVLLRWRVEGPETWCHLSGEIGGQTQIVYGNADYTADETIPLPVNHPLDIHYGQTGLQYTGMGGSETQCTVLSYGWLWKKDSSRVWVHSSSCDSWETLSRD
mmetsp:Transcript_1647/g.1725  ORF Transcript_1647/g.1725 Transcript_1647/m.1725 type:complete len:248 (-) Transcript_1647:354-1097(-)